MAIWNTHVSVFIDKYLLLSVSMSSQAPFWKHEYFT